MDIHEASVPIAPAPQGLLRGQLARSRGPCVPFFPKARGLRLQSSSWCAQLSWAPTTMPHPTPSGSLGFRMGLPSPTLHSPSHSLKVSRVHGIGPISGLLCGGVFISVSLPLFGAPHPRHRVGQVYLCSLPCVGLSDMGRVYSRQLGLQFRCGWLTSVARYVRVVAYP